MTSFKNRIKFLNFHSFFPFKFPTSDIVQFRALVTPCLHACEPIFCSVANNYDGRTLEQKSYGRRRRRSIESNFITSSTNDQSHAHSTNIANAKTGEEELVLVQSIKILDSFEQTKNKRKLGGKLSALESAEQFNEELDQVLSEQMGSGCVNVVGLIMICSMFLLVQLLLIVFWSVCWLRRNQQHNSANKLLNSLNGSETGLSPYSAFTSSNSSLHSTGKHSRCLPSLTNAQSTCSSAFAKNHHR